MKASFGLVLCFLLSIDAMSQNNITLQPFMIDHRNAENSVIDLSYLLEKPAGKQGFVTVRNGHFYKRDGKRLRLWGVNITDWTRGSVQIPSKEDAAFWAKTLSRFGVNCVRLTFLDFLTPRGVIASNRNDTRALDSAQIDKFDYWIYQLKQHGIYIDLNLLVGRRFKQGDEVTDYDKIGWAKYVSYFDERLIELQKEFAKQLLTHYNGYTKTEYRNEPSIVIVELVNENTLFDAWHRDALHPIDNAGRDPNFRNLTPHYSALLTKLFNQYLLKSKTAQQLSVLRKQAGVAENELIPRIRQAAYQSTPKELFQATVDFYTEVETRFFQKMNQYLKDSLKTHSLILGSNDFLHNQSEYPMVASNAVLDMEDGHVYWQHPSWPGKINTAMVNEPDSSTIVKLSRTALAGKPYTVTEVNHAFPNDYECEGIPLAAAYGSLQDWDAIMWYTFEPKVDPKHKAYVGDAFDISFHPVKMPQLAAGALMFLRGDVHAAKQTIKRNYTKEQINETLRMDVKESPYYTPGFPTSLVLKHQLRIGSMQGPPTQTSNNSKENPVISDTKELSWFTGKGKDGLVKIETANSQGLVGFLKVGSAVKHLSVDVNNNFCAVTLSSLDNKPIISSSRLLLTTGARVENTGMQWNENRTRARVGGSPSLIEQVTGTITLKGLQNAKAIIVTPLNGSGKKADKSTKAIKTKTGWEFAVGEDVTTWYEVRVFR